MIPGVVAQNMSDLGAGGGGGGEDIVMDFVNGIYTVGATAYSLAETITQTGLVTAGVGLVIPNRSGSPGIQEILGPFNDRLLLGNFTFVLSVASFNSALNGLSVVFNIQDDDLNTWLELYTINSGGGTTFDIHVEDFDSGTDNHLNTSSGHYNSGSHKIGVTRHDTALPLALAIDGSLIGSITASPIPTAPWTLSNFGGDYIGGSDDCRNGLTIQSLTVIDAVALGDLAALTA